MIAVMGDHDRDAILARRTLFISAALAGIACTTHEPPDSPQSTSVSVEPREPAEDPGRSEDKGEGESEGVWPSWSEMMAQAPPLDVPEGLTESEHSRLTSLAEAQRHHYEALGKLWDGGPPACAPSEADCGAWAEAIATLNQVSDRLDARPLCGTSPEVTNTIVERQRVHALYLRSIIAMLLEALDATVEARANPADTTAWASQREDLGKARPRPCLSCVRPTAQPITERIPFEPGQAVLPTSDNELQRVRATHQSNAKSRLIVRGHADPGEPNAETLALERAKAVAARLIELGIARADLEVRSYGTSLLITSAPTEAALNRRVDFEVVPPAP